MKRERITIVAKDGETIGVEAITLNGIAIHESWLEIDEAGPDWTISHVGTGHALTGGYKRAIYARHAFKALAQLDWSGTLEELRANRKLQQQFCDTLNTSDPYERRRWIVRPVKESM